jgi:O-methyltransferase
MDVKSVIRDSPALRVVQRISGPLVKRLPVETMPGWIARMHGMSVPARIMPLADPSPGSGANIKIILSLVKSVLHLDGALAECGVYRGSTLIPLGLYLAQNNVKKKLLGFDSFEGFGDLDRGGSIEGAYFQAHGTCNDTSYEMVQSMVDRFGLSNVTIVKGFFNETLPKVKNERFCFVNLDVDLYESYKVCLEFFYDRMVPGGVILLDEYNDPPWPGCNRAVDEFLADKPEDLAEVCTDNYIKYVIRKGG